MATWTKDRRDEAARLLTDLGTFRAVADAMGLARGSVCWASARYGIGREPAPKLQPRGRPKRYRRPTDDWEAALTERWAERGAKLRQDAAQRADAAGSIAARQGFTRRRKAQAGDFILHLAFHPLADVGSQFDAICLESGARLRMEGAQVQWWTL